MPLSRCRLLVGLFAIAALPSLGCGGKHPVASVTGTVVLAGKKPLTGGNITFYLESNPALVSGAVIKSDGTFAAVDVPVGVCKVVVDNSNLDLSKKASSMPMAPGRGMPGMPGRGGTTSGPPANAKDKMGGPPKGIEAAPEMNADQDTGAKKFLKIDPAYTKVETTTLRHTVTVGENSGVIFEVK